MTQPTLGGVNVAYPDVPLTKTEISNAAQRRSADNTLLSSIAGSIKYKWALKWSYLSAADMAVLKARALVATSQAWVPPDEGGTSYTCIVTRNTLKIMPEPDEDAYIVEFELEEA